jgi:hypothetical protein
LLIPLRKVMAALTLKRCANVFTHGNPNRAHVLQTKPLGKMATVPNLAGLTETNADAALIAAHLKSGTVTGTTGVVTTQSLAAGGYSLFGTAIDYTVA